MKPQFIIHELDIRESSFKKEVETYSVPGGVHMKPGNLDIKVTLNLHGVGDFSRYHLQYFSDVDLSKIAQAIFDGKIKIKSLRNLKS